MFVPETAQGLTDCFHSWLIVLSCVFYCPFVWFLRRPIIEPTPEHVSSDCTITILALFNPLRSNWLLLILEHCDLTVLLSILSVGYRLVSLWSLQTTQPILKQLLWTSFENWSVFTDFHSQNLSLWITPGRIYDLSFVSSFLVLWVFHWAVRFSNKWITDLLFFYYVIF